MDKKKALVLATVTAVLFLALVPSAYAQTVEQGANYDKILVQQNPDGSTVYTNKVYLYDRILDGNTYKDYIFTDAADHLRVETMGLSVKLDKATCEFSIFAEGIIGGKTPLLVDDIIPYQSVSGSGIWNRVSSVDDAACQAIWDGTELKAKKSNTVGYIEYVFILQPDGSWKTELRVKNESGLNNRQFGFRQVFELNRDTISFGGSQKNLDNFDGQVFNRTWLVNNEAKVIELMSGQRYDFDLGFEKLSRIWVNDTGVNSSQLTFEYFYNMTILPSGSLLVIDPTFTDTTSSDGRVFSTTTISASCSTILGGKDSLSLQVEKGDSTLSRACYVGWIEFDISSATTDWFVLNATIEYDVTAVNSNPIDCTWKEATVQPSTGSGTTLLNDGYTGTGLAPSSSGCTTIANGKIVTFNATGISSLQTAIDSSQNWYGVVVFYTNIVRDAAAHGSLILRQNDAILSFTYANGAPEPPTNLSCTGIPSGYDCTWNAGANATDVTGYYISHSPNNSTWHPSNQTLIGNVTNYQYLGFGNGESNYIRVNATISNLYNTTSSNHFLGTTDDVPDAPSLSLAPINGTAVNATSAAGTSDGGSPVKDFALQCEVNRTGGWQSVVANSTLSSLSPPRTYTVNGLWSTGDLIICQWRDGNLVGWSAWSANATYPARPDAVLDLTVVGIFQTTAEIEWTEPELHGLNLTGYQVNFTTPWGNPLTEITTTNTSDTEYAVTGLVANTQYSMRVSAVTIAGNNASGNIINFATATNFTVGQIDIDSENPLRMPIRFVRDDINDTTTSLTVTYDNDFELDCEMYFKFSQTNQTFANINGTAASASEDEHTFYFLNPETEVINVDCYDTITNETGSYLMMQSDFPLLDLIAGFRDGTYGTQGMFGAIDLITLMAIILGMIGFNRTNPAVGVIFMFFIIGGLAAFGIVQWYTAVSGLVATLLLFAVSSTRKDD